MFAVSYLIRKIQSFRQDRQGMVAIVFGLAILPVMMTMGIAVDHSGAMRARNKMQSAADSAALVAVTTALKRDEELNTTGIGFNATAKQEAEDQARAVFLNAVAGDADIQSAAINIALTKTAATGGGQSSNSDVYAAIVTYTGKYKLTMPNPVGLAMFDLGGRAESSLATQGQGFMQISTLLDTSPSMGVGASPADIQILKNSPANCAFTCHHGQATYGAVLRVDVLRTAVSNMITEAQNSIGEDNIKRIKIALNRFEGNQHQILSMSDNYPLLLSKVSEIKINQDGTGSSNIGGAVSWITPTITQSGDGKTAENPKKFVFLVTDGMENRAHTWRPQNYLGPTAYSGNTGSIDPAHCAALKAKGVTIAVLYTTYYTGVGAEWAYQNALPGVKPNLQSCASAGFFFEAQNAQQMTAEFKKMFKKATSVAGVRLTK